MKFSDQLEQRFATMVTHYPTKRSVLVPMLLYIQDEIGALTDEAIHEIAQRTELTDLEVRNVISYYSMLRTHSSRQVQHPGLHQCELPAARRGRSVRALQEEAGRWQQGIDS